MNSSVTKANAVSPVNTAFRPGKESTYGAVGEHEAEDGDVPVEAKSKSKITRRQGMVLVVMVYCNFWLAACYSLLAPFFHEEAQKKGVSDTVYGLMFGAYQLVIFVISPIFGTVMPVITPKFMMNAGVFVTGSCSILFGLLDGCPTTTSFTTLVFLVRILEATGAAAYATSSYTFVAAEFPEMRATVLSGLETMYGLGMIVGPTVGGALYELRGYYLPFVTLGGILFIGGLFTFFLMPSVESVTEEKHDIKKLVFHPSFLLDAVIFFVTFLLIGFNEATLQPLLADAKFPLSHTAQGSIFIVIGGIYAFAAPMWGILADRMANPRLLCLLGCILCAIGILFLGPVSFLPFNTMLWLVIVSQGLLGFGLGAKLVSAFVHCMKDTIDRGFPEDVQTYAMISGIVMSMSSIGAFVGPFIGGLILDHLTYRKGSIVLLAVEILLTIVITCYILREKNLPKPAKEADEEEYSKLLPEKIPRRFSRSISLST